MKLSHEVLAESKSARNLAIVGRTDEQAHDALSKAKALVMAVWQGTGYATTEQVAEYYGASYDAIIKHYQRNEDEFNQEVQKLTGKTLKQLKDSMSISSNAASMLAWTARGMLRVGLMLTQSEVAKEVRNVVLNIVEASAPQPEPVYLPPLVQAREAIDIAKDYKEIFGAINPQIEQHLKDLIGNTLIEANQLIPGKERWMGVVNYAEVELGYYVRKKGEHRDSALGTWIRFYHPHLSNQQEQRLCNETQQKIWVYPVHEVGDELAKAISAFFAHPEPSTQLKKEGAFKRKAK